MKKKAETSRNYLDLIPVRSEKHRWETDADGNVTIFLENKGLFNRIAQAVFKKPKVSQIHLEKFGSFIFPLIDGKTSVFHIGEAVREHFSEEAEPLYPRLVQYFRTLQDYGFIDFL